MNSPSCTLPGIPPEACVCTCRVEQTLFSGDTLFNGGPGATGRSFSDRSELEDSIRGKLFDLPGDTSVRTGHGDSTTLRVEEQRSEEW